jgi:acyl-ACP thioesterase
MYSLKYKVTTSTCDSEGRLKLYSALQMMQDCSEMGIDSEPGIKQYFTVQNMAQLLVSRQVEIIRVPSYKEELTVTTSVYGMKPMFGFRNTFIYDAEGKPCYRTWSMGAFVDKSDGKLKRIDEATLDSMHLDPQLELNYQDRRIILPKEGGKTLEPIRVLRADIDYNKHMNNANYVRVAMELLPEDFEVRGLRVEHRVAAKLADQLIPTLYEQDGTYIVALSIGNEVSAIIEFQSN